MKVLVACEFSGIVRDAFSERGHDAISCDLLPTERPGPHIQGDVRELLREPWDLVIAHPPCRYLTKARGSFYGDDDELYPAMEFFIDCQNANAPKVAVENPTMYKFVRRIVGEPDCVVEPFHYGEPYSKRTCFWLKGLPPLMAAGVMPEHVPWVNAKNAGFRGVASNAKDRAKFFPAVAAAMAQQWGG